MRLINFVISYITQLYTSHLLLKSYSHIVDDKNIYKKNKRSILVIIIGSIFLTINNVYNYTQYKVLASFFVIFIMNKCNFKKEIKECFIDSLIVVIIASGLEILLSIPLLINSSIIIDSVSLIFKVIMSILVFKLTDILLKNEKINYYIKRIRNFAKRMFFFEATLLLIVFIINIILFFRSEKFNDVYNICAIIIFSLYIMFTLIQIIKGKYVIEKLEAKNKELTNSYKASADAMEQFRELKHNLKNDLFSIKSFLPKEKQIILNNLMTKYNSKYDWLNSVTDIPEGLQGIIYLKKIEAEKQHVKLNVNYNSTKEINEKDFLDICDILGIYLDNAIDASKESGDKSIVLDIRDYYDSMILKVINKFSNNVNLNEIGQKDYSTKNRNSGLGLNYIKNIKNKNINTKIQIVNNLFIASIEYKVKEIKKRI